MAPKKARERKLAVLLHADVVGSTALVQRDETLAHERITEVFTAFSDCLNDYGGTVHEMRGDALVAEMDPRGWTGIGQSWERMRHRTQPTGCERPLFE